MANGLSPNGNPVRMGTISWGTLRTQDLLRAFADEIEYLGWSNGIRLVIEAREWADALDRAPLDVGYQEDAVATLAELTEALCRACPPNAYFGTTEGDGSDFGFWECETDD